MSSCYGPESKGYIGNLTSIQKLIPQKYLYFKCLLGKKRHFFSPVDDKLKVYSEKGLLKQLDLFKQFKDNFVYINCNKAYIFTLKNNRQQLILYNYISTKTKTNLLTFIEKILAGFPKTIIKNIKQYHYINKYNTPISSKLNAKEEFEYKKKKLSKSKKLTEFKEQLELDYKKANNIIKKYKNDDKFKKFYKRESKKFKTKSFEKEIKEVKKSIFFTCKVATKYKKLFPNY